MQILEIAENIGILSFALSGLFISYKERLDILGLFIIMFLTALGGGVIRDVLTANIPYSFTHILPTLLILAVLTIGLFFKLHRRESFERNFWYILSDTLGLISFTIAGAIVALEANFNLFGVMFVALIIGAIIYLLTKIDFLNYWTLVLLFISGVGLRLLAYYRQWHLPKI